MTDYNYEKYRNLGALNEEGSSKKKKKKKDKKNRQLMGVVAPKPGLIKQYTQMPTKNNPQNALIKAAIDAFAAMIVGPAVSASLGKFAPLAGVGLAFGGHYVGDETGMLRGIGMSTIGHSLSKVNEYREPDSTIAKRLEGIKDDLLRMLLIASISTPKNSASPEIGEVTITPVEAEPNEQISNDEDPHFSGMSEEDDDNMARAFETSMAKANEYLESKPANGIGKEELETSDETEDESLNGDDFSDPDFIDFNKM